MIEICTTAIKSGAQANYVDYRETSLDGYDGVLIPGGFHLETIYVQVQWLV